MFSTHTVQMLPLGKLHAHPLNPNAMPGPVRRKLRNHIARTGHYEPLVVRPHPEIPRDFQIVHGQQRASVLRELEHANAACLVWNLNDAQTLTLLATANRLRGKEKARLRLNLIRLLHESMAAATLEEFAAMLPEQAKSLQRILEPEPHLTTANRGAGICGGVPKVPAAFIVFLPAEAKRRVDEALAKIDPNPAAALVALAAGMSRGSYPPDNLAT